MSSKPTILYRRLDANHDPVEGGGLNDYLVDIDAVAQAIQTRLLLFQGEWWENTLEGLPLFQRILGVNASQQKTALITQLIQQRILGTPYVTGINNIQVTVDTVARALTFRASVQTQFGTLIVANFPQPPNAGIL